MPDDARHDQIERAINREVAGALTIRQHGASTFLVAPRSMSEVMEFAKLMSVSGICIRPVFRGNPGACLAITLQAMKWGADPFAVANKAFEVNGQLSYEAQLIHAIVNSSPVLEERLYASYTGEGPQRQCLVTGMIKGEKEARQYLSPKLGDITPKNSPLWKTDPDQQLFYYSTRAWARRWVPEILLGIYAPDELTIDHEPPPPRPRREDFADERQERPEALAGTQDPAESESYQGDSPQAQPRRRRTKAEMEAARQTKEHLSSGYHDRMEQDAHIARVEAEGAKSYAVVDPDGEESLTPERRLAAAPPATTERPIGLGDAPEHDRQGVPLADPPPARSEGDTAHVSYMIEPVYTKAGQIDRAWWIALLLPKLRAAKTREEFAARIADNGETIQAYKNTLTPSGAIAAAKEIDDILQELVGR